MLDEHRTPRKYWAEAVNTACYVSNRIFLRAFMHRTSYELRFGRQPRVDHLRVFGCRCFVLKDGNLDKFESRSSDGVFLGYASHSRAYRVLITSSERLVKSLSTRLHRAILPSLRLQMMMSSVPPSLKMRRKKLRRVMLRLPRVLWTQLPPPRARTMMTAPNRLHLLPGGRSSR